MVFDEVQADLEAAGYEVIPFVLPAAGVNAPHRRDRVWFVAHSERNGHHGGMPAEKGQQYGGRRETWSEPASFVECGETTSSQTPKNPMRCGCTGAEVAGVAADTESLRVNRAQEYENSNRQDRERGRCDANYDGEIRRTTPDTDRSIGRERWMHPTGPGQATRHAGPCDARIHGCGTWDNFPTQPPVRGRNDGISSQLDGITVSKHRNESIKAYGNAIVPQVALQIFRAIDMYNHTHTASAATGGEQP